MNLIRNDAHMVFVTNVTHPFQFLASPYATRRIVRIAEQKDSGLLVSALGFEVSPVDFEAVVAATESQHTFCYFAAIILDAGEEAVVVGRQDEYFFTRHSQSLDGYRHGRHYPNGIEYPFTLNVPLVAAFEPRDDSLVIVFLY